MVTVVRREVRKRGFFGWFFLLLFLAFNAFMLWAVVAGVNNVGRMQVASEAERLGRNLGGFIGFSMMVFIWLAGAIVLGLIALLTRGRSTIITETVSGPGFGPSVDTSRWSRADIERARQDPKLLE